jgi:hypothetical protein
MGKLRFQRPKSRNNWNFCPSKLPNQLGKYDDGGLIEGKTAWLV